MHGGDAVILSVLLNCAKQAYLKPFRDASELLAKNECPQTGFLTPHCCLLLAGKAGLTPSHHCLLLLELKKREKMEKRTP